MRIYLRPAAVACLAVLAVFAACEAPFDKSAALRKAEKATQDEQFETAITILRDVVDRFPEDVEARSRLGKALALDNRPLEARLELMQVVDLDSTRADALEHLGMLAFGAEDRDEAIERLEQAVRMGARGTHIYDTLSYLHFQEGTIEEGKKWVRRAIQANPRDPRFRLKLATLDHFIGEYAAARKTLEALVRDYPNYWDAHLLLGQVYRQLGEDERALERLTEALKRVKGHADHLQELGMAKLKTGDLEGAIEVFEKVVLNNPEKGEAHYGLGQAYMKKGDREKARAALERFRQMQQNDKALKNKQAMFIGNWQEALTLEREGAFDEAYDKFQAALDYKQGDVGTQMLIWLLRNNQGRPEEAARALRTMHRLVRAQGDTFVDVAFSLAGRLIDKGFDRKAVEVLTELLKRDPEHRPARYQLIRAYGRLGMTKERKAQFEIFRTGNFPDPETVKTGLEAETRAVSFEAGYIGAEACAQCHKEKYETFRETAHHQTSASATSGTILGSFETGENVVKTRNSNLRFEMTREGDTFYQTAYVGTGEDAQTRREAFDLVIGSGKHGQTYLYWEDNRLYQLPITYMAARDGWVNSPGYEDGKVNFSRPIAPRCLECHSTYFEVDTYTTNAYDRDEYLLGISCERCHGPGSRHFEFQMEGGSDDGTSPYIVVPSKLPPERSLEICAQCHSGSGVEAFGKPFSHRVGEDLSQHYKLQNYESQNKLGVHAANQIARVAESKCFRESPAMTCVDCHNLHVRERGKLDVFSDRCLTCHETGAACGLSEHIGAGIEENCIDCHLPLRDMNMGFDTVEGFQFQQMRDHNIAIYPEISAEIAARMGKPLSAR